MMNGGGRWLAGCGVLVLVLLSACQASPAALTPTLTAAATLIPPVTGTVSPAPATLTPMPTRTVLPAHIAIPSAQAVGPDSFPEGVNPLTGLPVSDPALLSLAPGLVSISNSPSTTRPQSGLSYADFVYEMYIGEGVTRFLSIFYGEYPPEDVGPLRSGRLPHETLRELYRGYLVFGSASSLVMPHLEERNIVFGVEGAEDPNTAFISPEELKTIAADTVTRRGKPALTGLRFDPQPPDGGKPAERIWVPYHYTDQVFWEYDKERGTYLRLQGDQAGERVLPFEDKLTGMPLTKENVVVLFAQHRFFTPTFFDIDLVYISRLPALIFRDGNMYEAYWTTANEAYERTTGRLRPIRFIDGEGNPFPLKNGRTWVMIVPQFTAYNETVESFVYGELQAGNEPGSATWAIHFQAPV
ncbi:MAG: DUF3048 domain-containing protein, partial [Anaerolineaceae bacterium]|nr:DUF3048 domain-containing protein [Anaerolineaceae bacterium]